MTRPPYYQPTFWTRMNDAVDTLHYSIVRTAKAMRDWSTARRKAEERAKAAAIAKQAKRFCLTSHTMSEWTTYEDKSAGPRRRRKCTRCPFMTDEPR